MKQSFLVVISLLLSMCNAILAQVPHLEWVIQEEGIWSGNAIALDHAGMVISAGVFEGTIDFDPGPGTFYLSSNGERDVFIQKVNPQGQLIWAKSFGGIGYEGLLSLAVDADDNIITSGYFENTVDFDPGAGSYSLTEFEPGWSPDAFIQKLDPAGNFIWAKNWGGEDWISINSLAVDETGDIFSTGYYTKTIDFDPGPAVFELTSSFYWSYSKNNFILRLDKNGSFKWVKTFTGSNSVGECIQLDPPTGDIYVCGYFDFTIDADPGSGLLELKSNGFEDAFLLKLDHNGNLKGAFGFGGGESDWAPSLAIDPWGNLFLAGYFSITADFDPGPGTYFMTSAGEGDLFLEKLSPEGALLWARQTCGPEWESADQIQTDAEGNVYVVETMQGPVLFDPSVSTVQLTPQGQLESFMLKRNKVGNFCWVKSIPSSWKSMIESFAVDSLGNIYSTGYFWGTSDFDPTSATYELTSLDPGPNIFLSKWSQGPDAVSSLPFPTPVSVFPNPTTGRFTLDLGAVYPEVEVGIFTLDGKVIHAQQFTFVQTVEMDVQVPPGMYLQSIREEQGGRRVLTKIIKM